jgi:hypothetical protein
MWGDVVTSMVRKNIKGGELYANNAAAILGL